MDSFTAEKVLFFQFSCSPLRENKRDGGKEFTVAEGIVISITQRYFLVKSQLSYATVVWSPASVKLRTILERVQRRATRWILRSKIGEMSYKQRLLTLDLLPLTYDRKLRDLVFLYNCIFWVYRPKYWSICYFYYTWPIPL